MRSAISPETPVSISSNTIVGSFTAPAIIALDRQHDTGYLAPRSYRRNILQSPVLVGRERKFTVSAPMCPRLLAYTYFHLKTGHWACPAVSGGAAICFSTSRAAAVRNPVSTAACRFTLLYKASLRAFNVSICSSDE